MSDELKTLQLAALLHDIGKFWQRAGKSGRHHEVGEKFIREYIPKSYEISRTFVSCHHDTSKYFLEKGYNDLKKIVIADWLSSGEREDLEGKEKGKPKIDPLSSIFSQINPNEKENNNQIGTDYYYELNSLSTTKETIFPKERLNLSKENYNKLWDKFVNEINNIKTTPTFKKYFNKLYYILQKYTWCVPSAVYKSKADISLFDHLKTTSAIVACIYSSDETYLDNSIKALSKRWKIKKELEGKKLNERELQEKLEEKWKQWIEEYGEMGQQVNTSFNEPKFSLIHGDISGIQNFIYSIKTKYAAKSLKGRSLFLVLLNRFIAENVLKKLELPITNLLFCGGGNFYILSPKISDDELNEVRKDINNKLFDKFKTKLYLAIGKTDLCAKNFVDGSIAEKWKDVADETVKQKMRRYKEADNVFDRLFSPSEEGANKEICGICGSEDEIIHKKEEDKIYNMCKTCNSFVDFAEYLKEVQKERIVRIFRIKDKLKFLTKFNLLYDKDYYTTPENIPFINIPLGIPTVTKDEKESIKTFEQLAKDWEEEKAKKEHVGAEKLGILKMDVDNLGKLFTRGLGKNATISRMSVLSRMMSLFFEGYLNTMIKNENYKNHIYLIYAGGDDTFIVGRWDKVIEIAYDIYKDFREYTCKNKYITISAGIVIVNPRYPLRKSSDKAEDMLDIAKNNRPEKNSIAIFKESLKWDINKEINDFEEVKRIKEILIDCVNNGASKQLIQRVKGFDEWLNTESKRRKYIRQLKYYLYRNFKKKEENKMNETDKELWSKIKGELIPIFDKILENNIDKNKKDKYNIMCIPIAARLAEFNIKGD